MNDIITEIKEVLKISPARFSKIYYRAIIEAVGTNTIKVTITSSFDFLTSYSNTELLKKLEKWNATGLAIGCLEKYLEDKGYVYSTSMSSNKKDNIVAEVTINV